MVLQLAKHLTKFGIILFTIEYFFGEYMVEGAKDGGEYVGKHMALGFVWLIKKAVWNIVHGS